MGIVIHTSHILLPNAPEKLSLGIYAFTFNFQVSRWNNELVQEFKKTQANEKNSHANKIKSQLSLQICNWEGCAVSDNEPGLLLHQLRRQLSLPTPEQRIKFNIGKNTRRTEGLRKPTGSDQFSLYYRVIWILNMMLVEFLQSHLMWQWFLTDTWHSAAPRVRYQSKTTVTLGGMGETQLSSYRVFCWLDPP